MMIAFHLTKQEDKKKLSPNTVSQLSKDVLVKTCYHSKIKKGQNM